MLCVCEVSHYFHSRTHIGVGEQLRVVSAFNRVGHRNQVQINRPKDQFLPTEPSLQTPRINSQLSSLRRAN